MLMSCCFLGLYVTEAGSLRMIGLREGSTDCILILSFQHRLKPAKLQEAYGIPDVVLSE